MSIIEIFILSIGLAMDAVAVSFACSASDCKARKRLLLKAALLFGIFQAGMPLIGYSVGLGLKGYIQNTDHWIAFLLLTFVGLKMFFDSDQKEESFSNKKLLILAIATSIDALVVGVTFTFVKANIWHSILMIGLITFVLSSIAGFLGKVFSRFEIKSLKFIGGGGIIFIGVKILVDHLFFQS